MDLDEDRPHSPPSQGALPLAEPEVRRRRRPAVSCTLCRRRKIRCNHEQPCSNCLRSRQKPACVYEVFPPREPPSAPSLSAASHGPGVPLRPRLLPPPPPPPPTLSETVNTAGSSPSASGVSSGRPTGTTLPSTAPSPASPANSSLSHRSKAAAIAAQNLVTPGFHSVPTSTASADEVVSLQRRIQQLESQLRLGEKRRRSHDRSPDHSRSSNSRSRSPSPSPSPSQELQLRHDRRGRYNRHDHRRRRRHRDRPDRLSRHVPQESPALSHESPDPASIMRFTRDSVNPQSFTSDFYVSSIPLQQGSGPRSAKGGRRSHHHRGASALREAESTFGSPEYGPRMPTTSRSVMHKTRLFGQSHWINSIVGFRDIFDTIEPLVADTAATRAFAGMQRIKHLGRVIKALRMGSTWPPPPPPALAIGAPVPVGGFRPADFGLPSRALADELIDCYMRSTESIYRVVHVPMFRREYEAMWQGFAPVSPSSSTAAAASKPDPGFLAQLKLMLAIGTATHRDFPTLRTRAARWYYAAHLWISEPEFKVHLTMQVLQVHILLLLAREAAALSGSLIWISVGDLMRSAVYMGLHRDPCCLPKRISQLAAEMRRRLWNTILELAISSSIDAGAPPMISLHDFDTQPPGNFSDEDLVEDILHGTTGTATTVVATAAASGAMMDTDRQARSTPAVHKNAGDTPGMKTRVVDGDVMHGEPEPRSAADMVSNEKRHLYVVLANDENESSDDESSDEKRIADANGNGGQGQGHSAAPDGPGPFTQTSVAIALRKTLPLRLAIARLLNHMVSPSSYTETLCLDKQFRIVYRTLCVTLQEYTRQGRLDHFVLATVDLMLRRYLLCLHIPFFGIASMSEESATYAFSRRVVLDTALRIWQGSCPGVVDTRISTRDAPEAAAEEAKAATRSPPSAVPPGRSYVPPELVRQAMLGSGGLRRLVIQAGLLVVAELKSQLIERKDDADLLVLSSATMPASGASSFGSGMDGGADGRPALLPVRPDLLAVIESATHWCLRGVEAGETNFKGYLLWRLIGVQIDGMRRRMKVDLGPPAAGSSEASADAPSQSPVRTATAREILAAAEDANRMCIPLFEAIIMREHHEQGGGADDVDGLSRVDPSTAAVRTKMCLVPDCPCQGPGVLQDLASQQQQMQQMQLQQQVNLPSTQAPSPQGVPMVFSSANLPPGVDPLQMPDSWGLLAADAHLFNLGNGDTTNWLFNNDMMEGILW